MKVLLRNFLVLFRRFRLAMTLNVLGLSVAFTTFMVILMQWQYDMDFDKKTPNSERIFRVDRYFEDGTQQLSLFDMQTETDAAPVLEPSTNPEREIRVSGHSRKKKRTLEELCATLPVEERIVDLPDEEKANANGQALVCIGQEYIRTLPQSLPC